MILCTDIVLPGYAHSLMYYIFCTGKRCIVFESHSQRHLARETFWQLGHGILQGPCETTTSALDHYGGNAQNGAQQRKPELCIGDEENKGRRPKDLALSSAKMKLQLPSTADFRNCILKIGMSSWAFQRVSWHILACIIFIYDIHLWRAANHKRKSEPHSVL